MDHGGHVHRNHAGQLVVGHLDGVIDAVVQGVRTVWAEGRLVGVEDHLGGLGADGVNRDLPSSVVRPADGLGQVRRLPVNDGAAGSEPNPLTDARMGHLLVADLEGGPSGQPIHQSTRGAWTHYQ